MTTPTIETIKVGDIFVSTWGYEQTNIDFYQIIEVKGQYATFQEICSKEVEGSMYSHGMACQVVPVKDSFIGEPIKKKMRFNEGGASCNISTCHCYYLTGSLSCDSVSSSLILIGLYLILYFVLCNLRTYVTFQMKHYFS